MKTKIEPISGSINYISKLLGDELVRVLKKESKRENTVVDWIMDALSARNYIDIKRINKPKINTNILRSYIADEVLRIIKPQVEARVKKILSGK